MKGITASTDRRFMECAALLLGLSLGTNVMYLFTIGSTHFVVSEIFSAVLFVIFLLLKRIDINRIYRTLQPSFVLFCLWILFSAICAYATFLSANMMYRYVVGVIAFLISCTTLIDTIVLFPYRRKIAAGIGGAVLANGCICVLQYIAYHSGRDFDILYRLFPQSNFHLNVYNFTAQGLFLEPSHMNQFLASTVAIWLGLCWKEKVNNWLVLILALICCILSTSGTSMVALVGIGVFSLVSTPIHRRVRKRTVIVFLTAMVLVLGFIMYANKSNDMQELLSNVGTYITLAFEGSNVTDESNAPRLLAMTETLKLIPQNPLGCGWNMVHTLLEQSTILVTASAFSDIIELVLELGVVGAGFYVFLYLKLMFSCWRIRSREALGTMTALLCTLTVAFLADYAINPCIMMVLGLGMCYARRYDSEG